MPISSRVSSSLKKRKRISSFKKTLYIFIFILFFASLFALSLTSDKLVINNIFVSGNSSVSESDISGIAEAWLNEKYLWFIRTDNTFLIKRSEIRVQILDLIPKIESVKIDFHGPVNVEIIVTERAPIGIWCQNLPSDPGKCFFLDRTGFVFGEAPKFGDSIYPEYFGFIDSTNAIKSGYFDESKFSQIDQFYGKIKDMKLSPKYFYAKDEHEYEVGLSDGGKIFANDTQSFEKELSNLQALIDSGYVKTDKAFLKKIDYIDLRFGNKVPIVIRK